MKGDNNMSDASDFKIVDGKLIKYVGKGGDVVIPDSVVEIGNKAFQNCQSLTNVVIPEGVEKIGTESFDYCENMTSVVIPESVTEIRKDAFCMCRNLVSINIPKNVTTIYPGVFSFCEKIESVVIPEGVKKISEDAFLSSGLTSITIPNGVKKIDAHAFQKCKSLESIIIPDSVTTIGRYAFHGCENVKTLRVKSGDLLKELSDLHPEYLIAAVYDAKLATFALSNVSRFAFEGSVKDIRDKKLKAMAIVEIIKNNPDASIPDDKERSYIDSFIKKNAELFTDTDVIRYANDKNLITDSKEKGKDKGSRKDDTITHLKLLWRIKNIDDTSAEILGYKGNEDSITIPSMIGNRKVVKIRSSEAKNEKFGDMKEVVIPDGVREIGTDAFCYCSNLKSVVIPDSVVQIEYGAFYECSNLISINIPSTIKLIDEYVFTGCSKLKSIVIPDSVIEIRFAAFNCCSKLTDITIPDSVTNIDGNAFSSCNKLTIHTPAGSYAEQYARTNGIPYETL